MAFNSMATRLAAWDPAEAEAFNARLKTKYDAALTAWKQKAEAAQESYGFDTLMDAGESKLPNESRLGESNTGEYAWPKEPPEALKSAMQKADEAMDLYDPFAADPPTNQQPVPGL